ncbi:hypothetical protein AU194_21580 [Mycobacterium sp. GA-2829]|nr:hypothetical protein AU194_21580 [Mycobacterium sp. GA-2829]
MDTAAFAVVGTGFGGGVRRTSGKLSEIDGVRVVAVEPSRSQVAVTIATPIDQSALLAAVELACHTVAASGTGTEAQES